MNTISSQLLPHQTQALDFALNKICSALYLEQGLGKTWVAAGMIEKLINQGLIVSYDVQILVICNKSNLISTWVTTLKKIQGLDIYLNWPEFKDASGHRVLIVNYEKMIDRRMPAGIIKGLVSKVQKRTFDLIVYDECHRLKDRGSKHSRVAARLKSIYKLALSGTPLEQKPMDLFGQMRFLDKDLLGTFTQFSQEFLRPCGYMGMEWEMRPTKYKAFKNLISPHILRMTKKETLNLPVLTIKKVPVLLLGKQRKIYNELRDEMVADLSRGQVTAPMAMTKILRLQQVCGGFVPNDDGDVMTTGEAKLRKLGVLLRRLPSPVVIFCRFLSEVNAVLGSLNGHQRDTGRAWKIDGSVGEKGRAEILRKFQAGQVDYLVCQIKTGGVGVDLYAANSAIIYSQTWSSIDNDQAISRLHRMMQERPVTIYKLVAVDTVDEDINDAIDYKRDVIKYVLKGLNKTCLG